MSDRRIDPVLVALSDALVITALERAWARVVPRSQRGHVAHCARHEGYRYVPIHTERVEKALDGAWTLCPMLARRYRLIVDVERWRELLDQYARALLVSCKAHEIEELLPYLTPLAVEASRAVQPFPMVV